MSTKKRRLFIGVILVSIAIAFSRGFSVGTINNNRDIELRWEDIILAGFGCAWIVRKCLSSVVLPSPPPLFWPILGWVVFGVITSLFNVLINNISPLKSFFYVVKEIEYFFLFYFIYDHLRQPKDVTLFLRWWWVLALINAGWILFQLFSGLRLTFYYGPTLYAEPSNPFGSGVFFLTLFIYFFCLFLFDYAHRPSLSVMDKVLLFSLVSLMSVGVFSSGSQAAFLGLIFSVLLTLAVFAIKTQLRKISIVLFPAIIFILLLAGIFFAGSYTSTRQFSFRKIGWELNLAPARNNDAIGLSRIDIWKYYLNNVFSYPTGPLLGLGKSSVGESHSQFIRNFVETGIIGTILFFVLVGSVLLKSIRMLRISQEPTTVAVAAGLFVCTMTSLLISIPSESFIYGAKISELYWLMAAMAYAVMDRQEESV